MLFECTPPHLAHDVERLRAKVGGKVQRGPPRRLVEIIQQRHAGHATVTRSVARPAVSDYVNSEARMRFKNGRPDGLHHHPRHRASL